MTDRDELVSAYLDGAATPDERARVEADASLLAEVERFRSIASATAGADDLGVADPFTKRRHLAAALDAFDALGAVDEAPIDLREPTIVASAAAETATEGESAVVADVVAMARPDRRRRPLGALAAAAAGVVMLVGVAGTITGGGDDDSADTAAVAMDAAEESADDAADGRMLDEALEAESMVAESADLADADDAMEEMAEADAMVEEESAEAEEAMEEAAADVETEATDEALGEADTELAESAAVDEFVIVDLATPDETLEQMLARWESDVPTIEPTCPQIDGRVTLHVAPGFLIDGDVEIEVHLHATDTAGADAEVVVYTLPECTPA